MPYIDLGLPSLVDLYRCGDCKHVFTDGEQVYTAPTEEHNGIEVCPLCRCETSHPETDVIARVFEKDL